MPVLFTTPTDIPEGVACRTLKIPNNGIWLGIFNAVLLETLNQYNWEQIDPLDMTIEETIEVCQAIINDYWLPENCTDDGTCLQPDGYRVLRLNLNGFIEQLTDGAWTAPTGDYEIPPTPARTEPTATERKCYAAANAQNVLEQTYEQVTDAITEGVTVAELAVIMATELTLLLGPAFGFIVPAFIFLLEAAALAFIEIAEFMGTDVWDEEFSDLLRCALLDCATDDGDVVTFDYQCIIDNLAKNVDLLNPLAQNQLLLFGQVNFMLSVIGIDGLNAAGATTEVEYANCDACAGWCYTWDLSETDGDFTPEVLDFGVEGEWNTGIGWQTTATNAGGYYSRGVYVIRDFGGQAVTRIGVTFLEPVSGNLTGAPPNSFCLILIVNGVIVERINNPTESITIDHIEDFALGEVGILARVGYTNSPASDPGGQVTIARFTLFGEGDNPFGESNCD